MPPWFRVVEETLSKNEIIPPMACNYERKPKPKKKLDATTYFMQTII